MEEQLTAGLPASDCGKSSEDMRWPEMCLHLCHQNWGCPSPRHSCAVRRGRCDMEWLCFLTVPEGLPEPAVLLCAKVLGIHLPYLSAGWSQHSFQCVLKTFHSEIPYMCLCWVPAAFHSGIHTRPPHACGEQGHGTWEVTAGGSTGKRQDRFQASSQPKSWNCRKLHWKDEKIKKRKGDLKGSKPAEWYKGEKQCWHETLPAAFHRPGTANLSQEVKQRKGVKWVKAKRTCGGMLSTSGKARTLSSFLHVGLWPPPDFGCPWRGTAGMWMGLDGEMSLGTGKNNSVSSAPNHSGWSREKSELDLPPARPVNLPFTHNRWIGGTHTQENVKREATQCRRWSSYEEDAFQVWQAVSGVSTGKSYHSCLVGRQYRQVLPSTSPWRDWNVNG